MRSYRIEPLPGYTPTIGRLVGMLSYARQTTIDAVQGLTRGQLDHWHDEPLARRRRPLIERDDTVTRTGEEESSVRPPVARRA